MMHTNDRVYVPDEHEYGYITGEAHVLNSTVVGDEAVRFKVRLDGVTVDIWRNAEDLLPVESVTLEGAALVHRSDDGTLKDVLVNFCSVLTTLSNYGGDDIRVTVERVKKEG